jgi:ABC-type polysaccharide/polyol phosphate transport system ATPase subunit
MAIELRNISVRKRGTLTPVALNNVNLRVEQDRHVALLAPEKAAINMLVDVICGANAPDSGVVSCSSRLSWPLPAARFLHSHQTFVANARFIARLYEVEQRSFIERVIGMAAIEDMAHERVSYCPNAAVSRFSFALAACLPFDIYFFTSTAIGEKQDREKYAAMIADLGRRSGILVATSSAKTAQMFCDAAYVIETQGAVYYDDMDAAIEHLERLAKKKLPDDTEEAVLYQEDAAVSDDFL